MSNLFKLYKQGSDNTPELLLIDQASVGSALGTTDLSTDLASLASKEYVADEVDKFNRSNLAGKVDSYDDLPHPSSPGEAYACPELTSNGTPLIDEYAVWSGSTYDPERFDAYKATYSDGTNATSWHSRGGLPDQYYMTFKTRFNATRLLLRNRYPYPGGNYVYAPREFSIEAKNSMGDWVTIYMGVNPSADGGAEYEVDFNNPGYYHEYRLNVTSTYPGDASSVYLCLDLVQLSGHLTGGISEEQDVRVGTMYLVGTEGNLDEYIFTEDLKWERMGEIRQSDVDLSGYTDTNGMVAMINSSTSTVDGYVEAMKTTIQEAIDKVNTEVSTDMDEILADSLWLENQGDPTTWPSNVNGDKIIFGVEPPYEMVPFEDVAFTPMVMNNREPYTIVPILTSATSDPNIEVLHYRTYTGYSVYAPWMAYSSGTDGKNGWHSLDPISGAYIGIYKKDGAFRFDQVTLRFGLGRTTFGGSEVKLQGSNDGVTWDTLADTIPPNSIENGNAVRWIIKLPEYVEYNRVRLVCNITARSYWLVSMFLIQDSAIHGTVKQYLD